MPDQLFDEQAEILKNAHDRGDEAFGAAAEGVLRLVVGYPDQVLGEAAQQDDGQRQEAFQTVLSGLSGVLTDARLRHDFVTTFDERLRGAVGATEEDSKPLVERRTLLQIGKAFLNSFPDEVGTFGSDLAAAAEATNAASSGESSSGPEKPADPEEQMTLETADPEQFGRIVGAVLRRAGQMQIIIGSTDTPTKHLSITTHWNGTPRLVFSHGPALRNVSTIGIDEDEGLGYYFANKQTVTGRKGREEKTTLEVEQTDFAARRPRKLEGSLGVKHGIKPPEDPTPLKDEQTIGAANLIIGEIRVELDRRQKSYDQQTASAQKRIDRMFS